MPLKWELVSPGLACFHDNLDEVNELLLLINCVCVSTNNNYLLKDQSVFNSCIIR